MNERWRELLVTVLLEVRAAYLDAGGKVLTHWDQIQDRLRGAARTSESVEQWYTALARSLQLSTLTRAGSSSVVELVEAVGMDRDAFLRMIEEEHGYLIALARVTLERRKGERAR